MKQLPNHEQAVIPCAKITKYLLCLEHPEGGSKAQFFLSFGFTLESWQILDRALRQHALDHEVSRIELSQYGIKYVIEGNLDTPDGRSPFVRSVWIIDNGEENPRLTTAYPLDPPDNA